MYPFQGRARLGRGWQGVTLAVVLFAGFSSWLGATPVAESPGPDALRGAFLPNLAQQRPADLHDRPVAVPADYALADGHFYRQGAAALSPISGFVVAGALWRAFQTAGGIDALGFPVSRQWTDGDGKLRQAFQRGILIAETGGSAYARSDVLAELSALGKDGLLDKVYNVPSPQATLDEAGSLALLERDGALRDAFLATFDWRERFGLPAAIRADERTVTLRTSRAVLRRWLIDSPEASAGAVTVIDGPALAAKSGLIPDQALRPSVSPTHGWLRVAGRQIVDGRGNPVRMAGINWSGFELRDFAPRGLAVRDYTAIVDLIAGLGFNTIRLPFSNEMVERNPLPDPAAIAACPACGGKRALDILDMIVDYAGAQGLRIVLDNHFSAAADQAGSTLWYSSNYPHAEWLRDWQTLAERYRDDPAVVGFDLRNEPHGRATWGSGDPATDWRLAAEQAGQAILAINPHVLIVVEGIEAFPKPGGGQDLTWWGANLQGARQFPVRLPAENLLYSPHDYGPSLWKQSWFHSATTDTTLREVWQKYWAYLNLDLDLPLLIGEIGTGNSPGDIANAGAGSQGQWFQAMISLLRSRDNLHWLYWNVDAQDQYALFDASYQGIANPDKLAALQTILGQTFTPLPCLLATGTPADRSPNRIALAR